MKAPETPMNESERLLALHSYQILDTLDEEEYDSITRVASEICQTPIAVISLVDQNRQWFKSKIGLEASETAREVSFCGHAINNPNDVFVVTDARNDDRFHDNPLVVGDPHVVFYAGVPLVDEDGFALGTICTLDNKPRSLNENQLNALKILSKKVITLLSLKRRSMLLEQEKKFLLDAINFCSPFYMILDAKGKIIAHGSNYKKSIPNLEVGSKFNDFFTWETSFSIEEVFEKNIVPRKLLFYDAKEGNLKFKCSIKRYDAHTIILFSTAVINSQLPIGNYKLNLNDFPKHDYITEFLFLQQAATKGLEDSKKLNENLLRKNKELEVARQDLLNLNLGLEKKVEERTQKVKSLALFPENNPNPIFEVDFGEKKITYLNPAAKQKIKNSEKFSFEEITSFFKISEETINKRDNSKSEFQLDGNYYERNISFITDKPLFRLYLHNITEIRLKEKLEKEKNKAFVHQQEVLLEIRSLNQNLSLEDKLKFIYKKTSEILGCQRCSVWLYNEDKNAITADFIYLSPTNEFVPGLSLYSKDFPLYFKALETKNVIEAYDAETHPATAEFAQPYLRPLNIVSMLDIPLLQAEKSIGVICNEYVGNKKEFNDNDISFARSVADVIVLAYETEQLKISKNELVKKNQSLKEAMERLVSMQADIIQQEKLATLGMLIAGIAHEINTPLGAIKASNENIDNTLGTVLLGHTTEMDGELFKNAVSLLVHRKNQKTVLSTREERNLIKTIDSDFRAKFESLTDRSGFFSRKIYELGFEKVEEELIPFINHPKSLELFTFASSMSNVLKSVKTIGLAVDKATSVVKALNQFSHGNINKEQAEFNLKESLDNIITLLWNRIKKGAQVTVEIGNDISVFGNQEELSQVWTNILNNALQASNDQCAIKITYKKSDGFHHIVLSNNGPQIPPEFLPKIFDPFFSTKKRGEGTGLGLNIVKKIIEKHNGRISCISTESQTDFLIQLPISQATDN